MQKPNQSFAVQKLFGIKLSGLAGRRLIFLCLLTCLLLYYILPYIFHYFLQSYGSIEQYCLNRHLAKLSSASDDFDAVVNDLPNFEPKNNQIPFVGNGKIGAVADYEQPGLYVFYEKTENSQALPNTNFQRLPFNLLISPQYGLFARQETVLLNYRRGIVEHLACFVLPEQNRGVVFVNHTIVAHRSRPHLYLQHIEASVERKKKSFIMDDITLMQDLPLPRSDFKLFPSSKNLKLYGGSIKIERQYMSVAVALSVIPSTLRFNDDKAHVDSIAVVIHGELWQEKTRNRMEIGKLVQQAGKYAEEAMQHSIDALLKEHKDAWSDILHTGLSISHSKTLEPGIPHPLAVNSTLYSVLSSMDSKLHDKDVPEKERYDLMKRLQTPDFCYNDNPTLHAKQLWRRCDSVEDIVELAKLWSKKLVQSGCSHLVSEGAEGMLQAMVLSFGRLQFTKYLLQVHADSDILHNDIAFRGVMYKNDTVDIAIQYQDGTSSIQVSLRGTPRHPLYACEAGCLNVIEMSKQASTLPVHIIYPPSPILYISHSRKHLEDLKETIIVKKKVDHAQHMESKKEPGLPLLFWFGIGSLIVLFHLYLIRMICKEYYSNVSLPSHIGGRYNNRGRLAS